jgi:hypothetical protein
MAALRELAGCGTLGMKSGRGRDEHERTDTLRRQRKEKGFVWAPVWP